MKSFLPFVICLISFSVPVYAQPTLEQTQAELAEAKARQAALEKEIKGIQSTLDDTRDDLVSLSEKIIRNESDLSALEKKIAGRTKEKKDIEGRLEGDRESLGKLILALQRLRQVPPEAAILRPGTPMDMAQSSLLMESILPKLYGRAEDLKHDLSRLNDIVRELERDREIVLKTGEELAARKKEMATLLTTRQSLYKQTDKDYRMQAQAAQRLSAQAASLRELVSRIEENRKKRDALAASAAAPIPQMGEARLPVSGNIRVGFGQTDDIGATSQGLTIDTRPDGLVVSPLGGVVRYAGEFRNYGPMVIVEHQKDYHSLIAGLGRIDTVVGQTVSAGEPVGRLGNASPSTLYYELRRGGAPVDPKGVLKF